MLLVSTFNFLQHGKIKSRHRKNENGYKELISGSFLLIILQYSQSEKELLLCKFQR